MEKDKQQFMVYPTRDELKLIKKAATIDRRSTTSFIIKSALIEAELIIKEDENGC